MTTIRKTITVTAQQDRWIKDQIEKGGFTNDSEYVRDLLRKDQERQSKIAALRTELQKGLDSGLSNRTFDEIWEEGRQKASKEKDHV